MADHYDQYTWIFVLSTIFSFICAFGIGANDVANSFASSVGAKAITIGQAVCIAAVMEFAGAVGLGAGVTSTIKSGIADVTKFQDTPDVFMFGMFCVMIAAAFWDNLACHLELPVSTTHTTVGAIVGMALVTRGSSAVIWSEEIDDFPYLKGMTPIFLSWVISPVSAGICVLIIFGFIRTVVLRSEHSFQRAFYLLPVFVTITFFIITLFVIQTGNKNKSWDYVGDGKGSWISACIAVPAGVLTLIFLMPLLKKWVEEEDEQISREKAVEEGKADGTASNALADVNHGGVESDGWWSRTSGKINSWADNTAVGRTLLRNPVANALTTGVNEKIHDQVHMDASVAAVWEHAEVFDYKTERLFRYLQVFSAMVMSFAHGSNDVANAVGPYAGVYAVWKNRQVPGKNTTVPDWIYAMGGAGIVLGLATYGHHIMRVLGVKVAKLTNSRGFSAELATASVVLVASRYGLPVSTTQTICGAILAIGLFEGAKGVNWFVVLRTFGGWVITLGVAGFVSAAFVSFGTYAPSKVTADNILDVNSILVTEIKQMQFQLDQANAANLGTSAFNSTLNDILRDISANLTALTGKSNDAYINPSSLAALGQTTLNLFNQTLVA